MARRYDSRTTTFSPEGRLYQVEYAMEAISHAGICVGILAEDGIVLAVEKKITSKLLENLARLTPSHASPPRRSPPSSPPARLPRADGGDVHGKSVAVIRMGSLCQTLCFPPSPPPPRWRNHDGARWDPFIPPPKRLGSLLCNSTAAA